MPLMNSMGALKQQRNLINIPNNQWISQLSGWTYALSDVFVDNTGKTYAITPNGSLGVTKLDPYGAISSTFNLSTTGGAFADIVYVDASGNIYAGGSTSGGDPVIIKYDSSGTILWQKTSNINIGAQQVLSIKTTSSGDLFVLMGNYGYSAPSSISVYVLFKLDPSNGSIINQRKLLKYTTSAVTGLYVDNTNSQLLVTGTDQQTHQQLLTGTYNFTNTDTASNMIYQSSTSDDYTNTNTDNSFVADSTYIYQISYRVIGGIQYSVYTKTDRSTGNVVYSNSITISGNSIGLGGITKDNSGYIYINGSYNPGTVSQGIIAKIDTSTGSIVWIKRLGNGTTSPYNNGVGTPFWANGFIYFTATTTLSAVDYTGIFKLKDNGSVANGTYGGHWVISSPATPALVSHLPQTTGITTGANSTTVNTVTNTTLTKTSSSITTTVYSL